MDGVENERIWGKSEKCSAVKNAEILRKEIDFQTQK